MTLGEHCDPENGSLAKLLQVYFNPVEAMVKNCEPALKGIGRWNLELLGLSTRRSQAWLGIPARLGHCKSPLDGVNEQLKFWQTAASDYWETSHRLAAASWGACAIIPHLNDLAQRDYMTVQGSRTVQRDRRAA